MKLLRFNIQAGDRVSPYRMPYNTEADMEWAKENAIDGEIVIDEVPDPEIPETTDDVLNALLGVE